MADPILTALCRYADLREQIAALDDTMSERFGMSWRDLPEPAAELAELSRQYDAALELAIATRATDAAGIAAKLRLVFCETAGGACDWSNEFLTRLVLSAAIDASRLAGAADRELDRHFFVEAPGMDSLAVARAENTLARLKRGEPEEHIHA